MPAQNLNLSRCPSEQALKLVAAARTGHDDFGGAGRDAGLAAFLTSVKEESWPDMTGPARELAADYILHQLENRLNLMADRKARPEIAAQKIEAPLIVVGPPRSGSTLLHTLLNLDPENMAPEHWICREPSPPPAIGAPCQERLSLAEQRTLGLFKLIPDVFVTHPYMIEEGSSALAECGSDILSMAFTSQQLWCFWGGDIYRDYLLMADHIAVVRRIYDWAGLTMSDQHADAIRDWLAANRQDKHGKHKHSPEEFGMNTASINRKFATYTERFGFGFGIRPEPTV